MEEVKKWDEGEFLKIMEGLVSNGKYFSHPR